MKKFYVILLMLGVTLSASALSRSKSKRYALYLTDKMQYELGLTSNQLDAVYQINYDYFRAIYTQLDIDVYWPERDESMFYVLDEYQYEVYTCIDYFYDPISLSGRTWTLPVYTYYVNTSLFYNPYPSVYYSYRGRYMNEPMHYRHDNYTRPQSHDHMRPSRTPRPGEPNPRLGRHGNGRSGNGGRPVETGRPGRPNNPGNNNNVGRPNPGNNNVGRPNNPGNNNGRPNNPGNNNVGRPNNPGNNNNVGRPNNPGNNNGRPNNPGNNNGRPNPGNNGNAGRSTSGNNNNGNVGTPATPTNNGIQNRTANPTMGRGNRPDRPSVNNGDNTGRPITTPNRPRVNTDTPTRPSSSNNTPSRPSSNDNSSRPTTRPTRPSDNNNFSRPSSSNNSSRPTTTSRPSVSTPSRPTITTPSRPATTPRSSTPVPGRGRR